MSRIGFTDPYAAYYGSFYDTTTQSITNTASAYPITLNSTEISSGVTMNSSSMTFLNGGNYNIQWSGQFQNTNNFSQDAYIWIKKNGTDVIGSSGLVNVPADNGNRNGHVIAAWNYVIYVAANDVIQFYWQASHIGVTLQYYSASGVHPSTSSMIVTALQI